MFTFFTIVFALAWGFASFVLVFKVWDTLGPMVLNITKNHAVQMLTMIVTFLVIFGIPLKLWFKLFG